METIKTTACLSEHEETNKGHGRVEKRRVCTFAASGNPKLADWKNMITYIVVYRWRTQKGKTSEELSLYISDLRLLAKAYQQGTRGHWGIENRLHYVKDVVHNEDGNGVKSNNGPVVLSVCSSIAINIHRKNGHQSISYGQIKFAAAVRDVINTLRT